MLYRGTWKNCRALNRLGQSDSDTQKVGAKTQNSHIREMQPEPGSPAFSVSGHHFHLQYL